jgi:hypothetical protein
MRTADIHTRKSVRLQTRISVSQFMSLWNHTVDPPVRSGSRKSVSFFPRSVSFAQCYIFVFISSIICLCWILTRQAMYTSRNTGELSRNRGKTINIIGQLKCDGAHAETKFSLSAKETSPFKSAGASVHSTTGSRGVRINGSNAGYTMFRRSMKSTG